MFQANDNQKLPIELTNTTGTYLQDINEDCLIEIFSLKSLSLMDLCSIAESCSRFQLISQRLFPKNLRVYGKGHGLYDVASSEYLNNNDLSSQAIERILKNFGSFLSEISITSYCEEREHEEQSHFMLNLVSE